MRSQLIDCVRNSPIIRTVFVPGVMRRPLAVACKASHVGQAITWCKDATGAPPDLFYLIGNAGQQKDITKVSASELRADPAIKVVIFADNPRSIAINLATHGIAEVAFHKPPNFKNVKGSPQYLRKNADQLELVFDMLADEESRLTYASVIKHRITGDHNYLRIASYPEYSHPVVKALAGEWVVDGGAADGATSEAFARAVGASGMVHAFEPDPSNAEKILARISQGSQLTVHSKALGASPGTMRFSGGRGGSSRIAEDGEINVPIGTLDDLATTHALAGSGLISLDVEGFEEDVLRGGYTMLNELRPKLQISIYHHIHDLFSLPLWVAQNLGSYRLFVGHHDAYHCETDLYAVPE